MSRPTIVDVDYYVLIDKVKSATNARKLVERVDTEAWTKYVEDHHIRETSLEAYGKVKFVSGKPILVAIEMGSDWDGCYAYSKEDEAALKYVVG